MTQEEAYIRISKHVQTKEQKNESIQTAGHSSKRIQTSKCLYKALLKEKALKCKYIMIISLWKSLFFSKILKT